jgi:hypothetical protein
MPNKDYIPTNDAQFDVWQRHLMKYLGTAGILSGWDIPQAAFDALLPLQSSWKQRFADAENPDTRSHAQVIAKNEARAAYESALRAFVKSYVTYNPKPTDADREYMGLPVHKSGRTPAPVPGGTPVFKIDTSVIRRLTVHFYDDSNERRAKPAGVHGAEIKWDFSDAPVVNPDKLTHSGFDTASPYTIEFAGEDRGRTVYFALRWENTRGEKGPWGEIISAIVP